MIHLGRGAQQTGAGPRAEPNNTRFRLAFSAMPWFEPVSPYWALELLSRSEYIIYLFIVNRACSSAQGRREIGGARVKEGRGGGRKRMSRHPPINQPPRQHIVTHRTHADRLRALLYGASLRLRENQRLAASQRASACGKRKMPLVPPRCRLHSGTLKVPIARLEHRPWVSARGRGVESRPRHRVAGCTPTPPS